MARKYKPHPNKVTAKTKLLRVVYSEEFADDGAEREMSVKPDTLWWLLSNKHIGRHHYFAGRFLQWVFLAAQMHPPKCLLGGRNSRAEYPDDHAFWCLRQLARIQRGMSLRSHKILRKMICEYYGDDKRLSNAYKNCLKSNEEEIRKAFAELAYLAGYSTARNDAEENWNQPRRNRKVLQGEPTGVHPRGMGSKDGGDVAPLYGYEANIRFRDGAAI